MDEITILRKIAEGDRKAFQVLYGSYSSRVYNTALSYLQNAEDAEEITQDVFLEIHRSAGKFEERSSVSTWIYRIAVSKSLDKLKHRKRKKRAAILLRIFGPTGEIEHDVPNFDHPGVLLERKEEARLLFQAIDQLPEKQKAAYVLTYAEALPTKEVAEILQLSTKAVESLLQRAKVNLRKYLSTLNE